MLYAFSGNGTGTEADPYQITTVAQLQEMKDDQASHYRIMNDIDASETATWNLNAKGRYEGFEPIPYFTGTLHGGGYAVSGLTIDRNAYDVGFIKSIRNAVIDSLGLKNIFIRNRDDDDTPITTGGLAARGRNSTIRNCYVTGTIEHIDNYKSWSQNGGIVAYLDSSVVENNYSNITFVGDSWLLSSGGIIGSASACIVSNNYAVGTLPGLNHRKGGIIGNVRGGNSINNCYSMMDSTPVVGGNVYADTLKNTFFEYRISADVSGTNGTQKELALLKDIDTYTKMGSTGLSTPWDFAGTVNDDSGTEELWKIGEGLPFLYWMNDRVTLRFNEGSNGKIIGDKVQEIANGTSSSVVTASPNEGFSFVSWSDGITSPSRSFRNVGVDMELTARFAPTVYLNYSIDGKGSISGDKVQQFPQLGIGSAVTAVPNSGFYFAGWSDGRKDNPRIDSTVVTSVSVKALFAAFPGGDGTEANPYQIATVNQLQGMRDYPEAHFRQTADISATATKTWTQFNDSTITGFIPVGDLEKRQFSGSFNGAGFSISDLYINKRSPINVHPVSGLFGTLTGATVDSVDMKDAAINGGEKSGAVAGAADGASVIRYCTSSGSIYATGDGFTNSGGIVGNNSGTVTRSSSSATIGGYGDSFLYAGGIAGKNSGTVSYSESSSKISGANASYFMFGGIVGSNEKFVTYCKSSATIEANTDPSYAFLGGIVGYNNGGIGFSNSSGKITCLSRYTGGGIVGESYEGAIHNSYSSATIVRGGDVGGIVGYLRNGSLKNCYFAGTFERTGTAKGGVVGKADTSKSVITDCYYDRDVTNADSCAAGISKSSLEMKKSSTFSDWDFTSIWSLNEGTTYPVLDWKKIDNYEYVTFHYRMDSSLKGVITGYPIQWGVPGEKTTEVTAVSVTDGYRFYKWNDGVKTASRSDVIGTKDIVVTPTFGTYTVKIDTVLRNDIDTLTSVDSTIVPQSDTIVAITDSIFTYTDAVLEVTDTIINREVVVREVVVITGKVDTVVEISTKTLTYVPVLTIDTAEISHVIDLDTTIIRDTLYLVNKDTVVTTTSTELKYDSTFILIDSLHDNVSFAKKLDTLTVFTSTLLSVVTDTLVYVDPYSTVVDSSSVTVLDTSISSDTTVTPSKIYTGKSDTVVTSIWFENSTTTLIVITDSLLNGEHYSITKDTTITSGSSLLKTEKDTLFYVPELTLVKDSTITSAVDTAVFVDSVVQVNFDTLVTTTNSEITTTTKIVTTDSLHDGVSFAIGNDTTISLDTVVLSTVNETLVYVPTLTVVIDSTVASIADTVITADSVVLENLDTVVTATWVENRTTTKIVTTDSLFDNVSFSITHDTTITSGSELLTTEIDTLLYDTPVSVVNNNQKVSAVRISSNPVRSYESDVTFTLPEESGEYFLSIYDPVGNTVHSRRGSLAEGSVTWDLNNRYGATVGSGTYLVVLTISEIGGTQKLQRSMLGVQR